MRIGKRLLALLCMGALLLSLSQGALAAGEDTYVLTAADCVVEDNTDGGVTIVKINDDIAISKADITIPAQLKDKTVTAIGSGEESKWTFPSNAKTARIRLPEGLLRIEGYAFNHCSYLTDVNLPDSLVAIGKQAFYLRSGLTSIQWNEGLTAIGEQAFAGTGLNGTLDLPKSVISLGEHAFEGTRITAIGSLGGVTDMPAYAFSGCKQLTQVTIPAAIKTMGARAFYGCVKLQQVTIEEGGVTEIPDGAFEFSSTNKDDVSRLTEVNIPDSVTAIGASAFAGNSVLEQIALPANLISLGDSAFSGCRALTSIDIPDGVTKLGIWTFANCWALQEIQLPAGLKEVGREVFDHCSALQSLTFPAGLEKLGFVSATNSDYTDAFGYTPALRSITFQGSKPDTSSSPFPTAPSAGRHKDLTIYYPAGDASYDAWTKWGSYPKVATGGPDIPDAADTAITLSAVLRRSQDEKRLELWLTTDVTPKSHPENSAFVPSGAISFTLDGVALAPPTHFVGGGDTLHQTVAYDVDEYIGKTITVQARLAPSMGFTGSESNSLTGLIIEMPTDNKEYPFVPGGVVDESCYTFVPNDSGVTLTAITGEMAKRPTPVIPATLGGEPVTGLGPDLFANNNNTAYVTIPNSVKTLGEGIFRNCINLVTVSLPAGLTGIPADTFAGCTNNLYTVVLPGTVTTIGANAFQNCKAMTEMTFPVNFTTLDKTAFSGCNLTKVTFEGNAPANFDGEGKTNFGSQTIYYLKDNATGFDAAAWAGIRRPPVALGITYGTPTFTTDGAKHIMELPITFDTSAYTGMETAKVDLTKVAVTLNGFPTYGLTVKETTDNGGTLLVPIEEQFYGLAPFMWVTYPGDWYFNEAKYHTDSYYQMPTPKLSTAVTAATVEVKTDDKGILMLWVTPTITPANYFGQSIYRPDLRFVKLTLGGQELTSSLQVVDGKIGAKIPGSLAGRTVPLTVTFKGDDARFEASALFEAGNVSIPGSEPVTQLSVRAGEVYQDGQTYRLPLTVGLSIEYTPEDAPAPDRDKLLVTVNGQSASYMDDGTILNVLVPYALLDTAVDVVVSYTGESTDNYTYQPASKTLTAVLLTDPSPIRVNTTLTTGAGALTKNTNSNTYYLPVEAVLAHEPYKTTDYAPARGDITVTLNGSPASYTAVKDNILNVAIPESCFAETVTVEVTYPGNRYFEPSSASFAVDFPIPGVNPAATTLKATAGRLTQSEDGLSYYLPIEALLTHGDYGDTGYAPSFSDLKVTMNAVENITCTVVGNSIRIPITSELFFSRATIVLTYPGNAYFKPSAVTLSNVEIPLPNAPKANTTLAASSSGKLNFVMAHPGGLAGRYVLPVIITLNHEVYKGDSALKPGLAGISVTMDGAAVTDAYLSGSTLNLPLVESQYGKTVSIALAYPGEEHFNPSTSPAISVTISDPRTPSNNGGGGGGGGSSAPAPKPEPGTDAKVTVSDKAVTEAVKSAAESGSVILKADAPADAKSVAVTVPASVMKAVAKAEAPVSLQTPVADLKLDVKVLETLQANGAKDVIVSAGAADSAALPKAAQEALAGRPVYDISITAGGKSVSQFGGGTVTVALPYTPAPGEDSSGLVACWVKDDGTTEVLRSSSYKDGKLTFSTPHLSTYAILHKNIAFVDVTEDNWAKADIGFAASRGILNGMGDNLFGPGIALTGSMAVAALARMDGVQDGAPGTDWAAPALAWAKEKDLLPEGFGPDAVMTREQFAYLVAGFMGGAEKVNAPGYVDVTRISLPCLDSVNYLTSMGIMQGTGDGYFSPQAFLTRSELAAILHRLMDWQIG